MTNTREEKKDLVIHKPSALSYKDRSPRLEPERRVEQPQGAVEDVLLPVIRGRVALPELGQGPALLHAGDPNVSLDLPENQVGPLLLEDALDEDVPLVDGRVPHRREPGEEPVDLLPNGHDLLLEHGAELVPGALEGLL